MNTKLKILSILEQHDEPITLAELCDATNTSTRSVRHAINRIKKIKPIISYSTSKGYRMAKTKHDIDSIQHTINENNSRVRELHENNQTLYKFIEELKDIDSLKLDL